MKTVFRSTVSLTIAHGVGYAVSLAEIPILARALGPQEYGLLLWVQASALLGSLFVDWGFNLSASRQIAQAQQDPSKLATICGNVFLAKIILLVIVTVPLILSYLAFASVPLGLVAAGFLYLVAFGMSPFWYFQGTERMGRAVAIEVLTRTAALGCLAIFINHPEDAPLALALMSIGALTCTLLSSLLCRLEVGEFKASFHAAINQIRQSTPVFIYKSSANLVATAATAVLGTIAGKTAVGVFAPAEKVIKALIGLSLPVLNAFYPHLSRLFIEDRAKKERHAIILTVTFALAGLISALVLTFLGPTLMAWLLGSGFEQAGTLLLLMVWLIPIRLVNQTLGFAILLPAQLERRASLNVMAASIGSLGLGAFLALSHGAAGMVWGLLIGEAGLLLMQLHMSRHVFFRIRKK